MCAGCNARAADVTAAPRSFFLFLAGAGLEEWGDSFPATPRSPHLSLDRASETGVHIGRDFLVCRSPAQFPCRILWWGGASVSEHRSASPLPSAGRQHYGLTRCGSYCIKPCWSKTARRWPLRATRCSFEFGVLLEEMTTVGARLHFGKGHM